ncbi:MAG TPA: PAS domain-containing protein [Thermoanaerobaculia bacterium]|nr:PAS domain-containing protein [Thermoanaerobaculia bacterium]
MSTSLRTHADSGADVSEGPPPERDTLLREMAALRAHLEEAEETLRAIREGEVDALVVSERRGEQVYTLESADRPYRIMIEEMGQGAVTLTADGTILYCNRRFAAMLQAPLESLLGSAIQDWLAPIPLGIPGALPSPLAARHSRSCCARARRRVAASARSSCGPRPAACCRPTLRSPRSPGAPAWWAIRGSARRCSAWWSPT